MNWLVQSLSLPAFGLKMTAKKSKKVNICCFVNKFVEILECYVLASVKTFWGRHFRSLKVC